MLHAKTKVSNRQISVRQRGTNKRSNIQHVSSNVSISFLSVPHLNKIHADIKISLSSNSPQHYNPFLTPVPNITTLPASKHNHSPHLPTVNTRTVPTPQNESQWQHNSTVTHSLLNLRSKPPCGWDLYMNKKIQQKSKARTKSIPPPSPKKTATTKSATPCSLNTPSPITRKNRTTSHSHPPQAPLQPPAPLHPSGRPASHQRHLLFPTYPNSASTFRPLPSLRKTHHPEHRQLPFHPL